MEDFSLYQLDKTIKTRYNLHHVENSVLSLPFKFKKIMENFPYCSYMYFPNAHICILRI